MKNPSVTSHPPALDSAGLALRRPIYLITYLFTYLYFVRVWGGKKNWIRREDAVKGKTRPSLFPPAGHGQDCWLAMRRPENSVVHVCVAFWCGVLCCAAY